MIGGNISGAIQVNKTATNRIGEAEATWTTAQTLKGWLDLLSGDAKVSTYNAKIQESTHVFICDYIPLKAQIKAENARMLIGGQIYQITLIDNPMGLNKQIEIYLTYTGGQNG